ncbi:hypothetical protein DFH11DRAFT_1620521 [Phellopilus nigrolimitatus]|nr:hypothetical protein DFH11DRAFT_1620521 [Phellopilus nigrolimitatus]
MPGADRQNKTNAAGASRKPYTRVRFAQSQTDIAGPSTPPRKRTSPLLDIPQTGMKKRRADAVRRRSAEHPPPVASFMDDAVTSRLETRLRARGRMSYPSHSGSSSTMPFDMNPTPGPVRTTKFGMPEKEDFQDFPDVPFLDDVFVAPPPVDLQAKVKELQDALTDQARKYDALEGENRELQKELRHMKSKYQIMHQMYATAKSASKQNGSDSRRASSGDEMICDADDERVVPSAAVPCSQAAISTSVLSLSSSSSATSASDSRTPATTPGMPVREIDEDYDEGYNASALRLAAINDQLIMTSGMSAFDMEIERVAEQLHKRFNLNDDGNDVSAHNNLPSAAAFPSLNMPSMPKFSF